MADPTINDILDAIAALGAKVDKVDEKVDRVDAKVDKVDAKVDRVDAKVDRVDAKVDAHRLDTAAHRLETAKAFADLDKELARHSDPVHRKLEDEMAALRKLVMAKTSTRATAVRRPRRA